MRGEFHEGQFRREGKPREVQSMREGNAGKKVDLKVGSSRETAMHEWGILRGGILRERAVHETRQYTRSEFQEGRSLRGACITLQELDHARNNLH